VKQDLPQVDKSPKNLVPPATPMIGEGVKKFIIQEESKEANDRLEQEI